MSGRVREAFRKRGHDAYSVDLVESLDHSEHHFVGDARDYLDQGWDLLIAHPPCTYLCNSGWHWTVRELRQDIWTRYEKAHDALALFMSFWESSIPKIAIENPIPSSFLTKEVGKYHQTIQPYQFGDDASKRTCLWLKELPSLVIPAKESWVQPRIVDGKSRWSNQTDNGQNKEPPSEDRGSIRSLTYPGIAEAFASQWG